ncbi:MAG: DNA-binding protein [Synergistaceae bacterium]|nr:DNA-binding protein [Synergistaceae bacterium]
MQFRRFGNKYFVRIDKGEEIMSTLKKFCEAEKITLAEVKALGAVDEFDVGLFDVVEKKYHGNKFRFPAEITSLWGTVTTKEGKIYLHIHMSAADVDGKVWGGHLVRAVVSATCEMIVDDISEGSSNGFVVERKFSEEVGLNLFEFLN